MPAFGQEDGVVSLDFYMPVGVDAVIVLDELSVQLHL